MNTSFWICLRHAIALYKQPGGRFHEQLLEMSCSRPYKKRVTRDQRGESGNKNKEEDKRSTKHEWSSKQVMNVFVFVVHVFSRVYYSLRIFFCNER